MGNYQLDELRERKAITKWTTLAILSVFFIVTALFMGCPTYRVYQQQKAGEARLKEAESSRKIAVLEAKAKLESAVMLSQVDTIRALGVARSNQIIGASLRNNEAYLHWLWIDNIEKNPQATIYIPTEANLPIFEAGRLSQRYPPKEKEVE